MSVDFEKLITDYLQEIKAKNPNPDNDPYKGLSTVICETSAKVCVDLLRRYEELKSKEES
ncbi:hypothetical protein [Clostridium kluyveri]|uniref:Uncharacterized protein n=1 Tax=Clostridium kluyveri (strain ATCC 8527 / DSM 555 / NBRC 12016 / NCIMB 10680 / K1) TaxID=431943 RepID=A5MYS4_CLOK5|nr:hypothetical protein [Clostridium kluyveri]EDK34020.1 Hypothetical protein CKL_2008 [Clostridium kluyveri DSM 555]